MQPESMLPLTAYEKQKSRRRRMKERKVKLVSS